MDLSLLDRDSWAGAELAELFTPAVFADPPAAARTLQRLARAPAARTELAALLPALLARLSAAGRPDQVLTNLERLAAQSPDPAGLLRTLAADPRLLEVLAAVFSGSQFLTEILLRSPEALPRLSDPHRLSAYLSHEQYFEEAAAAASCCADVPAAADALRRYQRGELLRIGAADLLAQFDLATVTRQLSNLADGLVRAALGLAWAGDARAGSRGFAVLAMGKLGGRELNYSSDIDLLFISDPAAGDLSRAAQRLIDLLSGITGEGFLYRVDMRLRPWGRTGALVISLDGYLNYLQKSALLWEKQALLKARPVAGDASLGEQFFRRAAAFLYSTPPETVRAEVRAMKDRTESHLRAQGRDWGEVKLGEGSIRDIEFVAQSLQLIYGARQPEIRSRNTLDALARLLRFGLLPLDDYRILSDGYIFLRTIEHHLQIMHYRQTTTLPRDPSDLAQLARRLGFEGPGAAELFLARYGQHQTAVRALYLKYLGDRPMEPQQPVQPPGSDVRRHVERMDPSYENIFSPADVRRHAALADALDSGHLAEVEAAELDDGAWRVTIVAYDYPGELAVICGLMFAHGLDILDGNVFTYEPSTGETTPEARRKIVDVFTVRPSAGSEMDDLWARYRADLADLLGLMQAGQRQEARVQLARRVALALHGADGSSRPLYPIEIELDNQVSPNYTLLRIASQDTPGFLYELTGALAFNNIYIARVEIDTSGSRISDTLYVTDEHGRKITHPDRQRELRAATVLIKHFTHLLPLSPDPESALLHFRQLIAGLFQRPGWPDELATLERGEVLNALAQVLGVSNFLWDDFLRMQHANLFPVVSDMDALATARSRPQLQAQLEDELRPVHAGPQRPRDDAPWREVLNAFKDREMFRIDMRHILGHTAEFWEFAGELSDLAEVVVNSAFHLASEDLRSVYGQPLLENGEPAQMAVLALGKFGGRELGFASDIELMFVYSGNGQTAGPEGITSAEFFEKVVENFTSAMRARREGIFTVDLQLRPYGKAGSLAVSLESFRRYFNPDGPAWPYERQALVRLRPVAGDAALGERAAALRDEFVYTGRPFDVTAMRAMRERQIRHLVKGGTFNAKFSPGGLVDLEYLVQGLQITHGLEHPSVRTPNTREALAALYEAGLLSEEDYTHLRKAHTFLRWLIDSLRVVAGNARDLTVPPEASEGFAFLARRLRYGGDTATLRAELSAYSAYLVEANKHLLS